MIMKKTLLVISASLAFTNTFANEMNTQPWQFPTPDQTVVAQNRALLFCDANPKKCPDSLFFSRRGGSGGSGGAGGGDSLVHPSTSSSANNITVVLSGDNSAVNLDTAQASDGNTLNTQAEVNPTIDYDEVLNITNNNENKK